MPARIWLRGEASLCYDVEGFREDVAAAWEKAVVDEGPPIATYTRVNAGIPRPQVTIRLADILAVEETR